MAIITTKQMNLFYEKYRSVDVTWTKEVISSTGLQPRAVHIKCLGDQWPSVLFMSSFEKAKVLGPANPAFMEKIHKANSSIALRLSFRQSEKGDPISFFINSRASGFAPYPQSNGLLQFINMQFSQRPPDVFVEIVGRMLEANVNSARRWDERILLTPEIMRKIGLVSRETVVIIQGVPRRCIIRDLSFSGAKVIIQGLAKFLVDRECRLRLEMEEPREVLEIPGTVVRFETVEGRKDLAAIAIKYTENTVPISYRMHLNDYIGSYRRNIDSADDEKEMGSQGSSADGQ